jgi:hypothetical protein
MRYSILCHQCYVIACLRAAFFKSLLELQTSIFTICRLKMPPMRRKYARLKTFLRTTKLEERLNNLAMAYIIHRDIHVDADMGWFRPQMNYLAFKSSPDHSRPSNPKRSPTDPWFDLECRELKRSTRRLERAYDAACRRCRPLMGQTTDVLSRAVASAAASKAAWNNQRRVCRRLRRAKRDEFWQECISACRSKPRQLGQAVDRILGRTKPSPMTPSMLSSSGRSSTTRNAVYHRAPLWDQSCSPPTFHRSSISTPCRHICMPTTRKST